MYISTLALSDFTDVALVSDTQQVLPTEDITEDDEDDEEDKDGEDGEDDEDDENGEDDEDDSL